MSGVGTITQVGVVGCGLMGSGIAEVSARAGLDVVVLESDERTVDAGRARPEVGTRVPPVRVGSTRRQHAQPHLTRKVARR